MSPSRSRPLLAEHVALVIGGGRGIGAATALSLGRLGAHVVVAARSEHEVRSVGDRVQADGGRATARTLDVRDAVQVAEMIEGIIASAGRLDHVVYCAGHLPEAGFVWDVDTEELRAAFDVHVLGPVLVAREVVPILLEQREGTLVFVSSSLPTWAIPGLGVYCASRAGENALVRTLASEVRGSGVRVELVTPPPTRTRALQTFRAGLAGRRSPRPAQPGLDPREVAEHIVGLCLSSGTQAGRPGPIAGGYWPGRRPAQRDTWRQPW
jgi:NAD(P)-dependent dehydrogenase (short-subunit alcohol dehydrogenase family)